MTEKDIFTNMTNQQKEIQWMLHRCIKNAEGDSKEFFRSLERNFLHKGYLSKRQLECLEDGYQRFS